MNNSSEGTFKSEGDFGLVVDGSSSADEVSLPTLMPSVDVRTMLVTDQQATYFNSPNVVAREKSTASDEVGTIILTADPSQFGSDSRIILQGGQVCNVIVGEDGNLSVEQAPFNDQVFSEVIATISERFLQQFSDDRDSLLERLQLDANISLEEDKENEGSGRTIRGNLQQIVRAQRWLETCLDGNTSFPVPDPDSNASAMTCDKAIMCDIIKLDKLSHFAMEHPRQARFSSLLFRQSLSAVSAVKERYRTHRRVIRRRKAVAAAANRQRPKQQEPIDLSMIQEHISNSGCDSGSESRIKGATEFVSEEPGVRSDMLNEVVENTIPTSALHPEECDMQDPIPDEESEDEDGRKKTRRNYEQLTPFKFFCKRCSFKTKRESHYVKHLLIHDKVKTLYNCKNCSFTTIRLSHLRRHVMSHSQTTYNCDQCAYKTDEMKLLIRHVKLKHRRGEDPPSPVQVLQCTECPYKTTKPYHFQRHFKVHNGEVKTSSRVYQCDQCSYKTNRKEHYFRHVNNVHSNKRPYLCDFCGKAFKRPDALKQHRITHDGMDNRTVEFKCGICQKKCRSQAHLNEHLAVHSNVRSFLCEICGASFKTRSVQRKHVVTIHKNPRAHPCKHCDKRFNTNYALRRHLRLHVAAAQLEGGEVALEGVGLTAQDLLSVDSPTMTTAITLPEQMANASSAHSSLVDHHVLMAPTNTLALTLQPSSHLTLSSPVNALNPAGDDVTTVAEGSTLVTIQESFDQGTDEMHQGSSTFIQTSEATTGLLYLTANFTQF